MTCLVYGEPCDQPELHDIQPVTCDRCGQMVEREAYLERPIFGARGHSLPLTHPKVHEAPCGLPCDVPYRTWVGPDDPPEVHGGAGCPRCFAATTANAPDFLDEMKARANANPKHWRDGNVLRTGTRSWWTRGEHLRADAAEVALILRDLVLLPLLAVALGSGVVVLIGVLVGLGLRLAGAR